MNKQTNPIIQNFLLVGLMKFLYLSARFCTSAISSGVGGAGGVGVENLLDTRLILKRVRRCLVIEFEALNTDAKTKLVRHFDIYFHRGHTC